MKILHLVLMLFLGGMAGVLATGCLVPKVLEERTDHKPASDPKVELRLKSEKPADVLVLYEDEDRQTGKLTRRAFYLFANQERVLNGKRPVFVEPGRVENRPVIPIFKAVPADTNVIPGDLYAISSSPWAFTLESHDRVIAEFGLPVYGDWLTAKKFFLFPLAAAADAVGVGAVAGGVAAVGIVEGAAQSDETFSTPVR